MLTPETGAGGLPYETDGDSRHLALGCKCFGFGLTSGVPGMYACIGYDDHVFILLKPAHCMSYLCVFKRSPLGVKICLSHAQIGLL